MEKLIGEAGTMSESGSEPFTPLMNQRRSEAAGNLQITNSGRSDGGQLRRQPQSVPTGLLMEDWPYVDSSPTDEVATTLSADRSSSTT